EPPTDSEHLLLAAGQIAGSHLLAFLQAREVLIDQLKVFLDLARVTPRVRPGDQVLMGRQVLKHPPALHHLGNAPLDDIGWLPMVNAEPIKLHGTRYHLTTLRP